MNLEKRLTALESDIEGERPNVTPLNPETKAIALRNLMRVEAQRKITDQEAMEEFREVYGPAEQCDVDLHQMTFNETEAIGVTRHEIWDELDASGIAHQWMTEGYPGHLDLGPCHTEAVIVGPPGFETVKTPRFSSYGSRHQPDNAKGSQQ